MINIVYLIPLDAIGGVEVAAKGVNDISSSKFVIKLEYIFDHKSEIFSFSKLIKTIQRLTKIKPDVLIISLWRSALVGIFVKLLRPRTKVVLFLHSEKDVHFIDFILTRLVLLIATEVWGDSATTLEKRLNNSSKSKTGRVISFDSRSIEKLESKNVKPNFIFWGRIGKEKAVVRSLIIFSKILKFHPKAIFKIIGSDGGALQDVKNKCTELKLNKSVFFYDEMSFLEIKKHAQNSSFYLQTSLFEGAAMSVIESMKLGLVPVVTAAGEISRYCNSNNSIVVHSDAEAARDIMMILESKKLYYPLSSGASSTWSSKSTYTESISDSCEKMLKKWF